MNNDIEMDGKLYRKYKFGSYKLSSTCTQSDVIEILEAHILIKNCKRYIPKE